MKSADVDPSLRAAEPLLESLDDGFSPPVPAQEPAAGEQPSPKPGEPALGTKSPF
jgi:hypothetical protein